MASFSGQRVKREVEKIKLAGLAGPVQISAEDLFVSSFTVFGYSATAPDAPPTPNAGSIYISFGVDAASLDFVLPVPAGEFRVFQSAPENAVNLAETWVLGSGGDGAYIEYEPVIQMDRNFR